MSDEENKKKVNKKRKATLAVRKLINETEEQLMKTPKFAREVIRVYKKELKRNPGRPLKSVDEEAYDAWLNKHPRLKEHQNNLNNYISKAKEFFRRYKQLRDMNNKKPARRAWKYITKTYLKGKEYDINTFYELIHKEQPPTSTSSSKTPIKKRQKKKTKKQEEKITESDKDYDSDEHKQIEGQATKESLYDIV